MANNISRSIKFKLDTFQTLSSWLAEDTQTVVWVQSLQDPQQLYLSASYTHVWRRDNHSISPTSDYWDHTLIAQAKETTSQAWEKIAIWQELELRKHGILLQQEWMLRAYELHLPEHCVTYIRDSVFFLYDDNDNKIAIAGIAREISLREFCTEFNRPERGCHLTPLQAFISGLTAQLSAKTNLHNVQAPMGNQTYTYVMLKTGERIKLAPSEMRCLLLTVRGETSKSIANDYQISHRTVEKHLQKIRKKLNCNAKAELLGKISGFSCA